MPSGTNDFDFFQGGPENDTFSGLGGDDDLRGAGGNDLLDGGEGDDFLRGQAGNDTLDGGSGEDYLSGGPGDDLMDGGAGVDRASFYGAPGGVSVDLRVSGPQNTGWGVDTLVNVEHVSGTPGSDTLTGDDGANWLWGSGGGNDVLSGEAGDDLLQVGAGDHVLAGGAGSDTVGLGVPQDVTGGVTMSLYAQGGPQNTGQGQMTLTGIENLSGTVYDDDLTGDDGANTLAGDAGNDTLFGGGGDDALLGDGAIGVLAPGGGSGPIHVFETGAGDEPELPGELGDGVPGDDVLYGGGGNDRLLGGAGDDFLRGQAGNDTLDGGSGEDYLSGGPGDDLMDGGAGVDRASFYGAPGGVSVDLRVSGPQNTGWGVDTLVNVEHVSGTPGSDTLTGDDGANWLWGSGGGNDVLSGEAGDDLLQVGAGDHVLAGGAGSDTVGLGVPQDVTGGVTIALWAQGGPQNTGQGQMILTGIENLSGTVYGDRLDGDNGANTLAGDAGNDTLFGGGGDDVLLGDGAIGVLAPGGGSGPIHVFETGAGDEPELPGELGDGVPGDDYMAGGAGNDRIIGGAGHDIAAFYLPQGSAGTLRLVRGAGAETGKLIVERVDGATVEAVFRIELTGTDGAIVTGLGSAADQGTDTISSVEELHFMVPQDPFNPDQFIAVAIAPSVWTDPNGAKQAHVNGSVLDDVLDLTTLVPQADATWNVNADGGALGADTIVGTEGNNYVRGGEGDDNLQGRGGDDYLLGDAGNDLIDGGAGRDTAAYELPAGMVGQLRLVAGSGADAGKQIVQRVDGATVETLLAITQTAPGEFTVEARGSAAGLGVDTVRSVEALDVYVQGAQPPQSLYINLALNAWVYEPNHDVGVDGTPFDDVIDLNAFHTDKDATWDRFANGGDGNDSIVGTSLNDGLNGDAGADTLSGGAGDDYLSGRAGNDVIDGGAGGNDIAAFQLPAGTIGTLTQVEGTGADAGKLFIERNFTGGSERVFEITFTGSGANLQATVKGLGSAAGLGTDTVGNVEQLHFLTEPFNQASFTAVRLVVSTPPLANNAFVNGSAAGELIDLAAIYPAAGAGVALNANGQGGDDTVAGHDGVNNLNGGSGNDLILGRGGDDLLRGGLGRDTFDGGAGFDRISFYDITATQGAEADLASGVIANDGFGNSETMTSIEAIGAGTRFVDRFYGDEGGNLFLAGTGDFVYGRGGDDTIILGGAAAVVDGGAGRDTLRMTQTRTMDLNGDGLAEEETTTRGVIVDLAQQRVIDDGFGQGGVVTNVEIVAGTDAADTLSGDSFDNELYGNDGGDSLSGGGGDDLLFGGAGNDTLAGGAGVDTALFNGPRADYTVTTTAGGYRVVDNNLANGDEGADDLSGIELLQFSDGVLAFQTGIAISPATISRAEGSGGGVTYFDFVVTRTGDLSGTLVLPYQIRGSGPDPIDAGDIVGFDGEVLNGTVSFAAGASTATIRAPVLADTVIEGTEGFTVTLAQPATGSVEFIRQVANGAILNDDNVTSIPPGWTSGIQFGDPHLVSLDGLKYEMQGVGEFVLVESVRGEPLSVQVRTEAVNAYASEIAAVATRLGAARVSIDAERSDSILVNGQSLTFAAGEMTKAVGNGSISLYSQNGANGWLISFSDATKAALVVLDMGDRLDITFAVSPDRHGDFRGLLGNFDGSTGNDLALRNGVVLQQPVAFADFYSQFVDSWRIGQSESLFDYGPGQTTATFTDRAFPPAAVSLDDFPTDLVAAARDAALAAGISDPSLIESAVKDYLLTGDATFISSSAGASISVTNAPVPVQVQPSTQQVNAVGVGAANVVLAEGQTGQTDYAFKVYRTDGAGTLTVGWSVAGAAFDGAPQAANAADFGGALPSGVVTFADGQLEAVVIVKVSGDTTFEDTEGFVFSIAPPSGSLLLSGSVQARILNDDLAPTSYPTGPNQSGGNGADTLVGTQGGERIEGGNGNDVLRGEGGADRLDGGNGNDSLDGGSGADSLDGGNGEDSLSGGSGADTLNSGNGNDWLDGGTGNDVLDSGNGSDTLVGGSGDDVLTGGNGGDLFVFGAFFGHDRITDFEKSDQIHFLAGTFDNFIDMKSHAQQVGKDVVLTDAQGDTLTLTGIKLSSLSAGDFLFG